MPWRHVVNKMPAASFTLDDFCRQADEADLHADPDEVEQIMIQLEELGLIRRMNSPRGRPARWVRTAMYVQH